MTKALATPAIASNLLSKQALSNQTGDAEYVGRFAPSPSGPLHLGSLYTALAGFLDARQQNGRWQLRIDDLDTPRIMEGATSSILHCLDKFGLHWDGPVYYQSQHIEDYLAAIDTLKSQQVIYACNCSRKQLLEYGSIYPGICRFRQLPFTDNTATRLISADHFIEFNDSCQGLIRENPARQHGDFIIKRRDGVFAYQLAVVIDDHLQQVNQVLRGVDLLDSTARQIQLQQLLNYPQPHYRHIPVIIDANGAKLSKQTLAQAVDQEQAAPIIFKLLNLLQQNPPPEIQTANSSEILKWAISHWRADKLQGLRCIQPY